MATATPTSSSSGVRVNRTSDEETTTTNRICVVHETTTTSTSSDSTPSDAGNELCSDYVSQRTDSTLTEGRGSDSMSDDNNNPQHQSDSLASLDSVDGLNISNKEEPQPFKEENSDRSRTSKLVIKLTHSNLYVKKFGVNKALHVSKRIFFL